jgi:dTDP-4-amino-4,6-dideoxygalactose transaminase
MLSYSRQSIDESDIAAVVSVLRSDWLTCGPMVPAFEAALCEYTGARYCVCVSSGTAALMLAYWVAIGGKYYNYQECGHGRMGRATTSPLTFVATANAAQVCGAGIGFVDVDEKTGNIAQYTLDCDVVVPVHYAGRACPLPAFGGTGMPPLVVEDACHALGAMDFDGCSRVGSCAHSLATVFSFHAVKPITTGEGGAITTNDEGLADELRSLRNHGRDAAGLMQRLGGNYRMTDIQAALGLSQLKRCDDMRDARRALARSYHDALGRMDGLTLPGGGRPVSVANANAWHLYPIRIKGGKRDAVKAHMNARGIGCQIHYSPIVPLHPYYRERFGYEPGMWPNAEAFAAEELSLPLHAGMTEADVERVVTCLREALAQ